VHVLLYHCTYIIITEKHKHKHKHNTMPQAPLIGGGAPAAGQSSSTTASYFVGAPLSKLCVVATIVCYAVFHAQSAQDYMAMNSSRILRASQFGNSSSEWHRYWSSKITFGSTGELVMGGMLLAVLAKQFEREMGTRKFGVFLVLINLCAIGLEVVFVGLTTLMTTGYHYQGPYALLGGLMYLHHRFTPRLHPRFFGILGFTFSEKSFYYLWFAQVVGYQGRNTIVATVCGIITAYVYINTNLHQTLDLPDTLAKPLTAVGAHLSEPPPRVLSTVRRGGVGGGAAMGNNAIAQAAAAQAAAAQRPVAPAAVVAPDPGAIEQLTSMGFERQQVIDALRVTNNNVERAADRLLAG